MQQCLLLCFGYSCPLITKHLEKENVFVAQMQQNTKRTIGKSHGNRIAALEELRKYL